MLDIQRPITLPVIMLQAYFTIIMKNFESSFNHFQFIMKVKTEGTTYDLLPLLFVVWPLFLLDFFLPFNLLLLFKPGTFHKLMIRVVGTTKTTPNRGPLLLGK